MADGEGILRVNGIPFDERERRLMDNCVAYATNSPAGLPGHGLMIIIAKLMNAYPVQSDLEFEQFEGVLERDD